MTRQATAAPAAAPIYLNKGQVCRKLGNISDRTLDRWRDRYPDFPAAMEIAGRPFWPEHEIDGWMAARREPAVA